MHGTRRSYVYFLDYSGSTRYDRGYYLYGACGEEVVEYQKEKPTFNCQTAKAGLEIVLPFLCIFLPVIVDLQSHLRLKTCR